MKIRIGTTDYTQIKNLRFASQTDITSRELPINEFSVEIKTTDNIAVGQYAQLYDDNNTLWAKYWIVDAEKYTSISYTIQCQSPLLLLSRQMLAAKMCESDSFFSLVNGLFTGSSITVTFDSNLTDVTINGYMPEQNARDRLQWLCFAAGAYIQTDFCDGIKIMAVDSAPTNLLLRNEVYYHPTVEYSDYVTAIRVTAYTYTAGNPSSTDEYVIANWQYWIVSKATYEIANPDVPTGTPENVIEVSDVSIINADNKDSILNRLSRYYFKRTQVRCDVINNGEHTAGQRCVIDEGTGKVITGFISSAEFSFGESHKSSLNISQADVSTGVVLEIIAFCDEVIHTETFCLPSGYIYNIRNQYVQTYTQLTNGVLRRVYRPLNEYASGTVGTTATQDIQQYELVLSYVTNDLTVIGVDTATATDDKVVIG